MAEGRDTQRRKKPKGERERERERKKQRREPHPLHPSTTTVHLSSPAVSLRDFRCTPLPCAAAVTTKYCCCVVGPKQRSHSEGCVCVGIGPKKKKCTPYTAETSKTPPLSPSVACHPFHAGGFIHSFISVNRIVWCNGWE